jgi:endonuclease YncB( thermonuclease family)
VPVVLTRYVYAARLVGAHDADTITLDVDLGFGVTKRDTFRLLGVQAPEVGGVGVGGAEKQAGRDARAWLLGHVEGRDLIVVTQKDRREGRGRYLASIYIDGASVAEAMIAAGHACAYDGNGKAPKWVGPGEWGAAG